MNENLTGSPVLPVLLSVPVHLHHPENKTCKRYKIIS